MPTYEYECLACKTRFERFQKFSDPAVSECPECGSAVRKVLFPAGIVFKGSGWYKTDSRPSSAPDSGSNGSAAGAAAGESKSDSKTDTKTDTKVATKTETKSESSGGAKSDSAKSASPAASTTTKA